MQTDRQKKTETKRKADIDSKIHTGRKEKKKEKKKKSDKNKEKHVQNTETDKNRQKKSHREKRRKSDIFRSFNISQQLKSHGY